MIHSAADAVGAAPNPPNAGATVAVGAAAPNPPKPAPAAGALAGGAPSVNPVEAAGVAGAAPKENVIIMPLTLKLRQLHG